MLALLVELRRLGELIDLSVDARADEAVAGELCELLVKLALSAGCDIPYRMLLPKTIDGLLAAGRSAIMRGPQIRCRYSVPLMGQAAGIAAALAVKEGKEPRNINVRELQRILCSR